MLFPVLGGYIENIRKILEQIVAIRAVDHFEAFCSSLVSFLAGEVYLRQN